MTNKSKVKVLIVDDSAVVRQSLTEILSQDPNIEIIGTASDPFYAAEKMKNVVPDVITLDIEMPRMDGLTFLKKIMGQHPIPVVICSTLAGSNAESGLKALEYGAVDIITKPKVGTKLFFKEAAIQICDIVIAASKVDVQKKRTRRLTVAPKNTADAMLAPVKASAMVKTTEKLVIVGASTGGTEALKVFLEALPYDCPPILIVQHMPQNFTKTFANRLNETCKIVVKEAKNNDSVLRGQALIAPGNFHMLVKRSGAKYYVEVKEGPLVSRHRPSVDVLFRSSSRYVGKNAIGVIMTGMGDDGAKGMLEMKGTGAYTIAQDEETSIVFGMPQKAIALGGVDKILALSKISAEVLRRAADD
jgi:two-component system, chemotaxis family, protein-glutamate methylesterase/glutaminase